MTPIEQQRQPLAELLVGSWIDPDSGRATGIGIAAIVIEGHLRGREAACIAALGLGRRIAVVSDTTTREVMGARIEQALAPLARIDPVTLSSDVHADMDTVEALRAATARADALIAVGSGTINDLAKFTAAKDGKPFAVFPTAPSMNGYTSANAAITVGGHKKTLPATLARGVFIDLEVLAAAPARMIRAGLGDSLCRSTAQVDWLLSHLLLGTPYSGAPFALLMQDEAALLEAPEALLAGDLDAMRALARTLVLSGIGMTLCGGSYPASQGEHLISHYIDMRAPAARAAFLHGEQVAVATLTMARLQEALLDGPPPVLGATEVDLPALQRHFGAAVGAECWNDFAPKRLDAAGAAELADRARMRWPEIKRRAEAVRAPSSRLAEVMGRACGPATSADIGVDPAFYAGAVRHARFLRDRFTFLDIADDAGMLAGPFLT
ncbi:MAG: sn-glycerol-1-phosphate dehydrogenase [Betaproteobacteria bacterium]